jgi:probable F420-dependent oxidoreductase
MRDPRTHQVEHIPCDIEFLVERAHRRNTRLVHVGNEPRPRVEHRIGRRVGSIEKPGRAAAITHAPIFAAGRYRANMAIDLGATGVWSVELRFGDAALAADAATQLEELGYSALWLPGWRADVFERVASLLKTTSRMVVATGIVSVWDFPATETSSTHAALTESRRGRFLLGLGISHAMMVDRDSPGRYQRPVEVMSAYLDDLDGTSPPVPVDERIIAALGPRMLRLAAARSAGTHPYLVTPEHSHIARQLLGPEKVVAPEQAVVLENDPARARQVGRSHLELYLQLPNYVNNWRRLGYTDDDFAGGGSNRLVDGLVAWGDEVRVVERLQAHHDAGADHVCIQVLGAAAGAPPLTEWRRVAEALSR